MAMSGPSKMLSGRQTKTQKKVNCPQSIVEIPRKTYQLKTLTRIDMSEEILDKILEYLPFDNMWEVRRTNKRIRICTEEIMNKAEVLKK